MENIAVSVIVPVYDVEKYIRQCIDSILEQTLREIEIIIVDDGSPDNCPKIIDEYAKRDSRIVVIHKKNGGVSAARNDGLSIAKGEYVFICDSDDWMFPDALEKMYASAKKQDADSVIADHVNCRGGKSVYAKAFIGTEAFVASDRKNLDVIQSSCLTYSGIRLVAKEGFLFSGFRNNGAPWMHMYRLALIRRNNLEYDSKLKGIFDDIWFNIRFYESAAKVVYVPVPVYHYRIMVGTSTKKFKPDLVQTYSNAFRHVDDFLKGKKNSGVYMLPYLIRKIGYLDRMMTYYFLHGQNRKGSKAIRKEFSTLMQSEFPQELLCHASIRQIERKKMRVVAWVLKKRLYGLYWLLRKHTSLLSLEKTV